MGQSPLLSNLLLLVIFINRLVVTISSSCGSRISSFPFRLRLLLLCLEYYCTVLFPRILVELLAISSSSSSLRLSCLQSSIASSASPLFRRYTTLCVAEVVRFRIGARFCYTVCFISYIFIDISYLTHKQAFLSSPLLSSLLFLFSSRLVSSLCSCFYAFFFL